MSDDFQAQDILEQYKEAQRKKLSEKMSALAKRRVKKLSAKRRSEIAKNAVNARWRKKRGKAKARQTAAS